MNDGTTPPVDPNAPPVDPNAPPVPAETPPPNENVGAPEAYEDFTLPDGFTIDKEKLPEAHTLFKELGLSQKGAQKAIDYYVKGQQDSATSSIEAMNNIREGWRNDFLATPLGKNFTKTKETIGRAYDVIAAADPKDGPKLVADFKEAMNFTGAGDHPAFIGVLHALAARVTEGRPVTPANPAPVKTNEVATGPQAMWPGLPSSSR